MIQMCLLTLVSFSPPFRGFPNISPGLIFRGVGEGRGAGNLYTGGAYFPSFTVFFFYLGFLSQTFTIHKTAEEGGGYFFNSSLPLLPASQKLEH